MSRNSSEFCWCYCWNFYWRRLVINERIIWWPTFILWKQSMAMLSCVALGLCIKKKRFQMKTKLIIIPFLCFFFFFWRNSIGNNFSIIRLKVSNITWKNLIVYERFTAHSLSCLSVNLHTNVHVIFRVSHNLLRDAISHAVTFLTFFYNSVTLKLSIVIWNQMMQFWNGSLVNHAVFCMSIWVAMNPKLLLPQCTIQ